MPAPARSRRIARRIAPSAYQIAHSCQWTKDYVARHSTDQLRTVRDDDVIAAVWTTLPACEPLVQPIALAAKHGKADHEGDGGAEEAYGPKAANGLNKHGDRKSVV